MCYTSQRGCFGAYSLNVSAFFSKAKDRYNLKMVYLESWRYPFFNNTFHMPNFSLTLFPARNLADKCQQLFLILKLIILNLNQQFVGELTIYIDNYLL